MKRESHIFERIVNYENIRLAHKNARRGKTHYAEIKQVDKYETYYLQRLQRMLLEKTFKNSKYETFKKVERGKEREIFKLPYFPDRIIHHAVLQVLEPIWKKILIKDTYQSIKGRGVHACKIRLEKALHTSQPGLYCLKLDIRKFYPSVDNEILKGIIRKKIKDDDVLWLLDEIIDSTSGIPIGNYLSQYFGNLYLTYFDHWIKEKMKISHYYRYCDDVVILHEDKDYLQYLLVKIEYYLEKNLKLELKNNYQIFPVSKRRIDFLGFRFDQERTYLRKSIVRAFKRKVSNIDKIENKRSAIMSYYGWVKVSDSKSLWNKYLPQFKTKIAV